MLEGFSRDGLFAFNWVARHPERVSCIYVDALLCDFKSWPCGKGKNEGSSDDWEKLSKCKNSHSLCMRGDGCRCSSYSELLEWVNKEFSKDIKYITLVK